MSEQLNVSASVQQKVDQYISLLKTYNEQTNIYSKKAYDKLAFHTNDSLMLAQLIGNDPQTIVDMGSGSGLPAVILAIALPRSTVIAVESKSRKTQFLLHAKEQLGLENFNVETADVHDLIRVKKYRPTILTAKAFKPYDQVLKLAQKFPASPKLFIPISKVQYDLISQLKLPVKCLDLAPYYYLTRP